MKTMNYLVTAVFVLLLGACTNQDPSIDEELEATEFKGKENQEKQEVFELDLRQYFVLNNIEDLENQKRKFIEQIEGGNEKVLPQLERVIDQLRNNYSSLENILDNTCALLKMRFEVLTALAEEGNSGALDELLKIEGKLERCGISVEDYLFDLFEGHPVMFALSIGSRCSPGHEWKCKNIMNSGKLLINVEEELADRTEARFKTAGGEVISTGTIIGEHDELEGILQIELQLEQIEEGVIELSTSSGPLEVPIEVQ